jgi:hypothetical protein
MLDFFVFVSIKIRIASFDLHNVVPHGLAGLRKVMTFGLDTLLEWVPLLTSWFAEVVAELEAQLPICFRCETQERSQKEQ